MEYYPNTTGHLPDNTPG